MKWLQKCHADKQKLNRNYTEEEKATKLADGLTGQLFKVVQIMTHMSPTDFLSKAVDLTSCANQQIHLNRDTIPPYDQPATGCGWLCLQHWVFTRNNGGNNRDNVNRNNQERYGNSDTNGECQLNNGVIQTATAMKEVTAITVAAISIVEMVEITNKIKETTVTTMDSTGIGKELNF